MKITIEIDLSNHLSNLGNLKEVSKEEFEAFIKPLVDHVIMDSSSEYIKIPFQSFPLVTLTEGYTLADIFRRVAFIIDGKYLISQAKEDRS